MLSRGQGSVLATPPSITPTMPSETPISCWKTSSGRLGCASHEMDAEALNVRRWSAIYWTSNNDGRRPALVQQHPVRAEDHGLRRWRQQRPLRARLPLDRRRLLLSLSSMSPCMCFDYLLIVGSSPAERDAHIHGAMVSMLTRQKALSRVVSWTRFLLTRSTPSSRNPIAPGALI